MISLNNHHVQWGRNEVVIIYSNKWGHTPLLSHTHFWPSGRVHVPLLRLRVLLSAENLEIRRGLLLRGAGLSDPFGATTPGFKTVVKNTGVVCTIQLGKSENQRKSLNRGRNHQSKKIRIIPKTVYYAQIRVNPWKPPKVSNQPAPLEQEYSFWYQINQSPLNKYKPFLQFSSPRGNNENPLEVSISIWFSIGPIEK